MSAALLVLALFTLFLLLTNSDSLFWPCRRECCQGVDYLLILLWVESFPQETPQARRESCGYLMIQVDFEFQLHCLA